MEAQNDDTGGNGKPGRAVDADELARFRRWLAEFDGDVWDTQIETDAATGKLDALATEALAEYHAGKATEI